MHALIIGTGYSGRYIAAELARHGSVCGTRRTTTGVAELERAGMAACRFHGVVTEALRAELASATHLVVCVAPARELPLNEPVLPALRALLVNARDQGADDPLPALQWIGYLSTIGVYGDHAGDWVDEDTPCGSRQTRSLARREAELAWQSLGRELDLPVSILRLAGIYGPDRNAVVDAIRGRSRMLIKPGQYFNRIHVEDLAGAVVQSALQRHAGILNITDDTPAPPQDVIRYAHVLVGKTAPEAIAFDTAELSPMARSFYSENKRVRNDRSRCVLGFSYRYPSYRQGLDALWIALQSNGEGVP